MAMRSAETMVARVAGLASLPAVYQRVRAVIDDPSSSMADLAQVVAEDAALTLRLLHVVNSVYFGMMSRVDTVSRAVGVLGMEAVHDIVLSTSVASLFKGMNPANMNMTRFWSHSLLRALLARTAAEMAAVGELERCFVAGLLADLGHLVMYQVEPELAERAQLRAEAENQPLPHLEREILGCDYAEVGAALMQRWSLPPQMGQAIAAQIVPQAAAEPIRRDAALLYLARVMAEAMERKLDNTALAALVNTAVWPLIGLKPADLGSLRVIAQMNHAEVVSLYAP